MRGKIATYVDELEAVNKNGDKIFIRLYSTAVKKDDKTDGIISIIHDITEQKEAEAARRESEEKYKTIFDNINDVIVRMNKYGKITEINSKVEEFYGFKREDVLGKHFTKLGILTVKDLPKMLQLFTDAVKGKVANYRDELETRDKAGNRIYVDVNSTTVKKNGKVEGTVTLISNVTERRKAEEALRKSEEKFSKVFTAGLNPICIITLEDAKFIDANESFLRFTGYTREEVIGHSGAELNLWVGNDDPTKADKKFFEAGKLYNFEINSRRKSGEIRTGLFSSNLIEIEGKLCLVTMITDITEQKWAEEALRESEEFTSSLLKNNPTPIFVTHPDTSIKYVNPAFEKLTGFAITDVIGMKTPYPWWPEENRDEIAAKFRETQFGTGIKKEMSYQTKKGERFWVEVKAALINQNGEKKFILVNWVDITERKQMEITLRESEEKFSLAFNTSPNVMSITALDGTFIEVNNSFLRNTGLSREEVIGRTSQELGIWAHPDDRGKLTTVIGDKGCFTNEEFQFRNKNGEIQTVLFSAEKISIGGKPRLITVSSDISERKRMEEALRFSDAAFKSIHECVIAVDNLNNITYWNDISEQIFGIKASEAIGKNFMNVIKPAEKRAGHQDELLGRLFDRGYNRDELLYLTPNGETWVDMTIQVIEKDNKRYGYVITASDITERKRAEKELQESQEKFSKAFSSASDAMAIFSSKDGKFLEVNDNYAKISGYSRDELIGQNADVLNMWGRPEDRERILKFIEKGQVSHEEFAFRTKSGEIRTCLMSAESINIGGESRMIVIVQDITERKQMETALRESEEFSTSLLENAPNPIEVINPDTSIKYVNPCFERLTGFTLAEVIGCKSPYPWWLEESRKETELLLRKDMEGESDTAEKLLRKKDGERFWVELKTIPVRHQGILAYLLVNWVDITERKRLEDKLIKEQQEIRTIIDSSPLLIFYKDKEGQFLRVNKAFAEALNIPEENFLGKTVFDLYSAEIAQGMTNDDREVLKSGRPKLNIIEQYESASGMRWVHTDKVPIFDDNGTPIGLIGFAQDITESKQMETALRESEEKFSKAFNASANAICITSIEDRRFLEANESFSRFTGYSHDEIIGHNAAELNLWVKEEEKQHSLETLDQDGRVYNREFSSRAKSGEIRVGLSSVENINIGGQPYRMVVITDITERKKMEEALKESEEKFSKAFLASTNAIGIASFNDNRYIEVNESFIRFTGYSREEIIGHSSVELGLWESKEALQQFLSKISEDGRFQNLELRSRMKSGEIRVGIASADIINIGGEPYRMVAITDITERKKAEEALRESEEKFSKAFLASPGAIAISTIEGGEFIDINESFTKMMGYSRAEAIGHTSYELNTWPDSQEREKLVRILKEQGSVRNELFKFRNKSGEIRLGLFSSEPITIGNKPCMISVNVDVTHQKKAEERLRLLSSVTQQVTDSIIVTDPDFKITYMNKAAQDLFGYTIDEALGIDIGLFNVDPLSRIVRKRYSNSLSAGKTWTEMLTKRRKDGSTFLCDCRRSPMFNEDGKLTSYIIVHRDITEQKEIEAKLKAQKQLIESILTSMPEGVLVTDSSDRVCWPMSPSAGFSTPARRAIENKLLNETIRVEQLSDLYTSMKTGNTDNNSLEFRYKIKNQEKIIACVIIKMDSGRMLLTFSDVSREREEEDKLYLMDRLASLGEMAAGLAHELNNPLTGILTLSQLLVNSDIPEEHKEDLQCIYSEAKRAANIVKNVLLFTRNNSYENGQSSVNEVVKEVFRLREHEEKINNINVVTNLQDNLPEIPLDKYQLQQVFLNIILNAEAAMKETEAAGDLNRDDGEGQ